MFEPTWHIFLGLAYPVSEPAIAAMIIEEKVA